MSDWVLITDMVQVILYDGRIIVVRSTFPPFSKFEIYLTSQGKLKGFDVRTNLILADSVEREYSIDAGVEMVPLGLYMIKGDNV